MTKLAFWIFTFFIHCAISSEAEDNAIIELLNNDKGQVFVTSPKGNFLGVHIFSFNGIVGVAVKKEVLLGSNVQDVKIKKRFVSAHSVSDVQLNSEFILDGKQYGVIFAIDANNQFGDRQFKADQSLVKVLKFTGNAPLSIKYDFKSELPVQYIIFGEVKLGIFAGKANAAGKGGKAKHKIFEQFPLGALVFREKDKVLGIPVNGNGRNMSPKVAFFKTTEPIDSLSLILNDNAPKNNKGEFYILAIKAKK